MGKHRWDLISFGQFISCLMSQGSSWSLSQSRMVCFLPVGSPEDRLSRDEAQIVLKAKITRNYQNGPKRFSNFLYRPNSQNLHAKYIQMIGTTELNVSRPCCMYGIVKVQNI